MAALQDNKVRDEDRLILEQVRGRTLLDVLAGLEPLGPDDLFPDIDDSLVPPKATNQKNRPISEPVS